MKVLLVISILSCSVAVKAQFDPVHLIEGNWMGIDMYQDAETYDGSNFFLPNEEFIIIDRAKIRIYLYPYSKSDEFEVKIDPREIHYKVGKNILNTEYSFTNERADTLVFTMHFINKTFVKMYSRVTSVNEKMEVDFATINELDNFGFNPSAMHHLFEIDTFHREMYKGFAYLNSLDFEPIQYLQFLNDNEISVNRQSSVNMERGYKLLTFKFDGVDHTIRIAQAAGTQSFSIVPVSFCQCDSIVIPYITVDWADRIRKDMKENAYKYR